MLNHEEYLQYLTKDTLRKILNYGRGKPRPCEWWEESQRMHIEKGVRHAMTYLLEQEGHAPASGENHLELALTRFAMANVQDKLSTMHDKCT